MKLTRSKISKLYNKKRQSLKRAKKSKPSSNKRRTFRNKKKFDLSRKTLKKHQYQKRNGGAVPKVTFNEDEVKSSVEPEKISDTVAPVAEEPAPVAEESVPVAEESVPETPALEEPIETYPTAEESAPVTEMPAPETPVEESAPTETPAPEEQVDDEPILDADVSDDNENTFISADEMKNMYIDPSVSSAEEQPVTPTDEEEKPTPTMEEEQTSPTMEEQQTGPTMEEEQNIAPTIEEEPTLENLAPEEQQEPILEEESTTSLESQPMSSNEQNQIQETDKPNKEELVQSLEKVVDYITDVVADRVSEKVVSAQSGEQQQDGFAAINQAAETMASSGGKPKFKKTRKFRLTKGKNKSKHMK